MSRFSRGAFTKLDTFVFLILFGMLVALVYMILRYVNGLKGSPRELYLMFFTKLTEYSAYGAASYTFVLYLSRDIGLGDSGAAAYYTVFRPHNDDYGHGSRRGPVTRSESRRPS